MISVLVNYGLDYQILYTFNEAVGRTAVTVPVDHWNGAEWLRLIDEHYDTQKWHFPISGCGWGIGVIPGVYSHQIGTRVFCEAHKGRAMREGAD